MYVAMFRVLNKYYELYLFFYFLKYLGAKVKVASCRTASHIVSIIYTRIKYTDLTNEVFEISIINVNS